MNREDDAGNNLFEGGFLGLDNIGPLDRSHLPVGGTLEQSDATGWMASYALAMASIAAILNRTGDRPATDLVIKFLEHFAAIADAMNAPGRVGRGRRALLRPARHADGVRRCRSRCARWSGSSRCWPRSSSTRTCSPGRAGRQAVRRAARRQRASATASGSTAAGLLRGEPGEPAAAARRRRDRPPRSGCSTSSSTRPSSSRRTGCGPSRPTTVSIPTCSRSRACRASIDYEPAESTTSMFGGNSNWRGPLWFPLNYLARSPPSSRYYRFFGDDLTVEYPTGSGNHHTLDEIAADLRRRLVVALRALTPDGRRPCFGGVERLQHDPAWRDNLRLQRVLPRRQRRRARRLPPDRLDRASSPT